MNNKIPNDIKSKITYFNNNFNNTAVDSCAFNKVLNSGLLSDMICTYIHHDSATVNESPNDFKFRLGHFAIECVNQIYKPYNRIVREEEVFHSYFKVLLNSLQINRVHYS